MDDKLKSRDSEDIEMEPILTKMQVNNKSESLFY